MNWWNPFKRPDLSPTLESIVNTILRNHLGNGSGEYKDGARERILKKFDGVTLDLEKDVDIDKLVAAFEEESLYGKMWD